MKSRRISFAGAGKVASALCRKIFEKGLIIDTIVTPTGDRGKELADECNASWSEQLCYPDSTDVVIVSVPDLRLADVLKKIQCKPGTIIAHTAGSYGIDIFPATQVHKGVFYPLQTFSAGRVIDFRNLPFLIDSSDQGSSDILTDLVDLMEGKAVFLNSEQRQLVHLAAVFISNFTNHMLALGYQIAEKAGVPAGIFYPLLQETVSKAIDMGPSVSQTGPAVRNDTNTIKKHLELLSFSPELQEIYREITRSIINYHNKL